MEDTYAPEPLDAARCPHCALVIREIYLGNPAVTLAWTQLRCPSTTCRGKWVEVTDGGESPRRRYWDDAT